MGWTSIANDCNKMFHQAFLIFAIGFTSILEGCREVFLLGYAIFIVYILVKWILSSGKSEYALRDWLGSIGLAAGICSEILFVGFWVYLWTEHRLIIGGVFEGLYLFAGGCLAIFGLVLGLTGRGWLRRSAAFVSLVMVFQWWGEMIFHIKDKSIVTIAMFVSLAVIEIILFGRRYFIRSGHRVVRQMEDGGRYSGDGLQDQPSNHPALLGDKLPGGERTGKRRA